MKKPNNPPKPYWKTDAAMLALDEGDIEQQMVSAYMNYFKANELYEKRKSYRTHLAARKWLRELRRLSKIRMAEIWKDYNGKQKQIKRKKLRERDSKLSK